MFNINKLYKKYNWLEFEDEELIKGIIDLIVNNKFESNLPYRLYMIGKHQDKVEEVKFQVIDLYGNKRYLIVEDIYELIDSLTDFSLSDINYINIISIKFENEWVTDLRDIRNILTKGRL